MRAHGLRGAVRVRPASGIAKETAAALGAVDSLYLDDAPVKLLRVRPEMEDLLLELEGVSDRDAAEALRGRSFYVERGALPPPDEDEVYLADLVGCEVVAPDGKAIGVVTGTYDSGGQDVLIVDASGKEVLLPFIEPMLLDVDLEARRITYDAPDGMIE